MAIYRLISRSTFGPAEIATMTAAYEAALAKLGITDRSDPRTETIALKIVHRVKSGEDDVQRVVLFAISDFATPKQA